MNISQKYRITILSPVHIGSGRKLLSGFDFYYDDRTRQTWLYDLDEICRLVSDNRKAIDELSTITGKTGESIHDFVRKYQIASNLKKTRSFSLQTYSKDLLEYIRDGLGNPLIPGSSIKGSLRSAYTYTLFNRLDKSKQQRLLEGVKWERRDKFAAQKIEKELFGEEPNTDIFKALIVTDATFEKDVLSIGNSQVMSLTQNGGWYWKKGYQDYPMSVTAEYIRPDSVSETTIRFNDFFINDDKAKAILHFDDKLYPDFKTLNRTINQLSRQLIEVETKFIETNDPRDELRRVANFYAMLERRFPDDSEGCLLRLGWGSGWTSMTGNILENHQDYLEIFRRQFRMGKPGVDEYPKSRKIFMNGRQPETVMGWIKMEMVK